MSPDDQPISALSTQAYESLVFANSAQYLADSIKEITDMAQQGDLYPPLICYLETT